jgi:hypothetical protein
VTPASRILTTGEATNMTNCRTEYAGRSGNVINNTTVWETTGSLIQNITVPTFELSCSLRTLYLHVPFLSVEDGRDSCKKVWHCHIVVAWLCMF